MDEKERRKAEVRARLEAQTRKKRGFMTPERKKRLRNLLRRKAAEALKREQERKAEQRRRIIRERTGAPKNIDSSNEATLQQVCKEYHKRIQDLENRKWDLERETRVKELELKEVQERVNDLKGKFVIPPLKKVSKTATQLEKIRMFTARVSQMDYRNQLKAVGKKDYRLEEDDESSKGRGKPEWAQRQTKPASASEVVSEAED
ncbi:troponin I-like isoform X2 [Brevipalpus obovatus]